MAPAVATAAATWKVEEVGRNRAVSVPETNPAADTPERSPKAAARRLVPTWSACVHRFRLVSGSDHLFRSLARGTSERISRLV